MCTGKKSSIYSEKVASIHVFEFSRPRRWHQRYNSSLSHDWVINYRRQRTLCWKTASFFSWNMLNLLVNIVKKRFIKKASAGPKVFKRVKKGSKKAFKKLQIVKQYRTSIILGLIPKIGHFDKVEIFWDLINIGFWLAVWSLEWALLTKNRKTKLCHLFWDNAQVKKRSFGVRSAFPSLGDSVSSVENSQPQ